MKTYICEDDAKDREEIQKLCRQFFQRNGIQSEIYAAGSAEEVLPLIAEIDLLILDIEMPGMDGVSLKNRLQRTDSKCLILFVTSHDEMMPEAFGVQVIGFVEKRLLSAKLPLYLSTAMNVMERDLVIGERYHSRDVVKIHSEREYCKLHFRDGTTALYRSSLRSMEEELAEVDFVRVSRAWLVNLKYVMRLEKSEIVVAGEKIAVSRGCRELVQRRYMKYCERNARYC